MKNLGLEQRKKKKRIIYSFLFYYNSKDVLSQYFISPKLFLEDVSYDPGRPHLLKRLSERLKSSNDPKLRLSGGQL